MTEERNESVQRGFFHTMVVMGGALALGCGGMSASSTQTRPGDSGTGGGGTGGSGGGGTGGTPAGAGPGGTGAIIIQGGAGQGTLLDAGSFECTPAEWACDRGYSACNGSGYRLPTDCSCDDSRPAAPDDCEAGEMLLCRGATADDQGRALSPPVKFDCLCVRAEDDCQQVCNRAYGDAGPCLGIEETPDGKSVLCGCAVIVLR